MAMFTMDEPILCGRSLNTILLGVRPGWLDLFDMDLLKNALRLVNKNVGAAGTSPVPELIFEPFRYANPEQQIGVIMGQDPYPSPVDAQGLCFSAHRSAEFPKSLKSIVACLVRAGLSDGIDSPDLRPWAAQGILMINASFTTKVGARNGHKTIWKVFRADLFSKFCKLRSSLLHPTHYLLWGGDADTACSLTIARQAMVAPGKHIVHRWTHPSPLSDNKCPPNMRFINCPHFEEMNAQRASDGLAPVVWETQAAVIGFTDGACTKNGQPNARASFAVYIAGGAFGRTHIKGIVRPYEYALVDEANPELGIRTCEVAVIPTNNRGELLAIIYCLLAVLRGRALGSFELCSDSFNSVMTLKEWYANRLAKGTENELKNPDLVRIAIALQARLKKQTASSVLTFCKAHQPRPPATAPARERYIWAGNDLADKLATNTLAETQDYAITVVSPLPVLNCASF